MVVDFLLRVFAQSSFFSAGKPSHCTATSDSSRLHLVPFYPNMNTFRDKDFVYYNHPNGDIFAGGFRVQSDWLRHKASPIVTLNRFTELSPAESKEVSDLFDHLVLPGWAWSASAMDDAETEHNHTFDEDAHDDERNNDEKNNDEKENNDKDEGEEEEDEIVSDDDDAHSDVEEEEEEDEEEDEEERGKDELVGEGETVEGFGGSSRGGTKSKHQHRKRNRRIRTRKEWMTDGLYRKLFPLSAAPSSTSTSEKGIAPSPTVTASNSNSNKTSTSASTSSVHRRRRGTRKSISATSNGSAHSLDVPSGCRRKQRTTRRQRAHQT